ncbi:trafficking protein particle complex subunit 2-like protein [Cucumis melo var. makuwa]|uniref:Trafficking protein particle complex subunit 2-like protein n=2 Tax=Cucumis melo var. makuwa TaxID=1194695 RepID=A0A5D3CLC8_CUCMM|nr:trafficking protein particle complex subunit 2-like protein [Cucumis melo var. makuwa]
MLVKDNISDLLRGIATEKSAFPEFFRNPAKEFRRPPSKMIVCVAVVGHQNNPLYIQSFTEADDALKLHHIVHCSLDVVDERVNNPRKSGPTLNETFLGLLYPTENYKVYGYLTNTKVKFIMVTTDLDVRDADVRSVSFLCGFAIFYTSIVL